MKINSNTMAWLLAGALVASLTLHLTGGISSEGTAAGVTSAAPAVSIPISKLDLSPSQLSSFRKFCADGCACLPAAERSLEEVSIELDLALQADTLDPDYVRSLGRQLAGLRAASIESCVESILLVRDVLDWEQIEELRSCCTDASSR